MALEDVAEAMSSAAMAAAGQAPCKCTYIAPTSHDVPALCTQTWDSQTAVVTCADSLSSKAGKVAASCASAGAATAASPPEGAEAAVLLLHQLGRMSLLEAPPGPPVAAALRGAGQQTELREWHQVAANAHECGLCRLLRFSGIAASVSLHKAL